MSYESRKTTAERDERYENLVSRKQNISDQVGRWVAEASQLHSDSPNADEKTDVLALRAGFIQVLKTHLGL